MNRYRWTMFASLLVCCVASLVAFAGEHGRCCHCGCVCECQKTCRVVCEMKEVVKVDYCCKCEDFCVPGRSTKVVECCESPCGECSKVVSWIPGCATVRTKKVAEKHETKTMKPTYKWVVEYCCPKCAGAPCNQ